MTTFIWIIIGVIAIFGILFFLYKKGKAVKDKELEEGVKILEQANAKKTRKKLNFKK